MSSELYLICHKVRGEPAFDVAIQCPCGVCNADQDVVDFKVPTTDECEQCDGEGFWWIIPTSGHRAYPYYIKALSSMIVNYEEDTPLDDCPEMPSNHPDHYTTRELAAASKLNLTTLIQSAPIRRRV